jgi:hypothetical protein
MTIDSAEMIRLLGIFADCPDGATQYELTPEHDIAYHRSPIPSPVAMRHAGTSI